MQASPVKPLPNRTSRALNDGRIKRKPALGWSPLCEKQRLISYGVGTIGRTQMVAHRLKNAMDADVAKPLEIDYFP
jgi:hypothetical protein